MGTQVTWEDELKTLLSGDWHPCFLGGFAVTEQIGCGKVLLYPPQGIYSCWTGKLYMPGFRGPVVIHGRTAVETVGLVRKFHDKIMEQLNDIDVSTGS